jgi:hypothetical protein
MKTPSSTSEPAEYRRRTRQLTGRAEGDSSMTRTVHADPGKTMKLRQQLKSVLPAGNSNPVIQTGTPGRHQIKLGRSIRNIHSLHEGRRETNLNPERTVSIREKLRHHPRVTFTSDSQHLIQEHPHGLERRRSSRRTLPLVTRSQHKPGPP